MAANGAIAGILAAQAAAERRALEAFRLAGATSPERAQPLETIGVSDSLAMRMMSNRGLVREAEPGTFWLDERALAERGRGSRAALGIVLVLLVLLIVAAVVYMMNR
jgi:hypothetical protein